MKSTGKFAARHARFVADGRHVGTLHAYTVLAIRFVEAWPRSTHLRSAVDTFTGGGMMQMVMMLTEHYQDRRIQCAHMPYIPPLFSHQFVQRFIRSSYP